MKIVIPAAVALSLLAGCSARESTSATQATQASTVTITDQWAKSAPDRSMTSVFGTVHNNGSSEARIVSATSPAARSVELHEVTPGGLMRPKEGGVAIPANGEHKLSPGGDHVMLMGLTTPLRPGQDVVITLAFQDGSTKPLTAQIRDFAGGNENYQP
ncbi:copper chaperone PCu(A)C [Mycobacteroides chelonae]|uniref:copper chaperone PCu(A)C n=1 Tax=Mycobacteroides chelonae TaxID=1774 RepID=UPI000992F59A|nr:copper chaperone PCu(A)C [Mycobacteroides chelonae]